MGTVMVNLTVKFDGVCKQTITCTFLLHTYSEFGNKQAGYNEWISVCKIIISVVGNNTEKFQMSTCYNEQFLVHFISLCK